MLCFNFVFFEHIVIKGLTIAFYILKGVANAVRPFPSLLLLILLVAIANKHNVNITNNFTTLCFIFKIVLFNIMYLLYTINTKRATSKTQQKDIILLKRAFFYNL